MRVFYLGLEPYQERYTEQLTGWVSDRLTRRDVDHVIVDGHKLEGADSIRVGRVLDAEGRCYWALTQMANLIADGLPGRGDWIWIDDMFHPGLEALPYILDQLPSHKRPRIAVRSHAQSVDPDDFTFPMRHWMREFETIADRVADVTFVASSAHEELMRVARMEGRIEVVGLPYDSDAVRAQGPERLKPWRDRDATVVYSSRFDSEKNPNFFMDIVEAMSDRVDFVVCTGASEVRSNDVNATNRLRRLSMDGKVRVKTGLTKETYYQVLADAKVQLNTARQDFVSYTACEASTFATPTLAPAFRAFPETLENRASQMFVPWSVEDACAKLAALLAIGEPNCVRLAEHQHYSLDRIIDVLESR